MFIGIAIGFIAAFYLMFHTSNLKHEVKELSSRDKLIRVDLKIMAIRQEIINNFSRNYDVHEMMTKYIELKHKQALLHTMRRYIINHDTVTSD